MKKLVLITFVIVFSFLIPQKSYANIPVIDVSAIANLIVQIKKMEEMINELNALSKYAKLDHEGLAGQKFNVFINDFRSKFNEVMNAINSYQNMFQQIERLDEVYFPYHKDWEKQDLDNQQRKSLKKQILWTRIQLKHAAKVGAVIREKLPENQEKLELLLEDTKEAQGLLLATQIGNQLSGLINTSLQDTNVQLNEYIQAYSAKNLEDNHLRGLQSNRMNDVLIYPTPSSTTKTPLNPIGAY